MMRDYSSGIEAGEADRGYLDWLRDHPAGLVLNLSKDRNGRPVLHRTTCDTISYDLEAKGHTRRDSKLCFEDRAELQAWRVTAASATADLSTCSRCKP
jgi:hypothetical protein